MSSLLSFIMASSLDMLDMNSSSESIPALPVVTGVGGAATEMGETAEDTTFFVGEVSLLSGVISASAALRFRVCGGIVPALRASVPDGPAYRRWKSP